MSEQIDRQYDVQRKYPPARLEKELIFQDYLRGLLQLGVTESQKTYATEHDARVTIERLSGLIREQLGEQPALSSTIMSVSGETVRLADTTIEKNDDGDVTIKTSYSLLGEYATRLFRYTNMYGELHKVDETDRIQPKIYLVGIDVNAAQRVVAGDSDAIEVRVSVDPTLLIPCEEGVEINSLQVEQVEKRMAALEQLMLYTNDHPSLIAHLSVIEQEIHGAAPNRNFALTSVDNVRQIGEIGKDFSTISGKHADALNTAIAEVFIKNRQIMINGVVYMHDDQDKMTRTDVERFYGKLVDVVESVPTLDEPTGQALALSARAPDGEKLCYVPLSELKLLYI